MGGCSFSNPRLSFIFMPKCLLKINKSSSNRDISVDDKHECKHTVKSCNFQLSKLFSEPFGLARCLDLQRPGLVRLNCTSVILFTWCVSSTALCSTVRPSVAPGSSHAVRQLQVTQELLLFFYFTPIVTTHQHLFCEIFHLKPDTFADIFISYSMTKYEAAELQLLSHFHTKPFF